MASRLKLARAQLVSAEQRWNGLVERHEFYEELVGERDDDQGGGDEGEGGGGGTISNGGRRRRIAAMAATTLTSTAMVPSTAPLLSRASAHLSVAGGRLQYAWRRYGRAPFYRSCGTASCALSVMVLWSEATLAVPFNLPPFAGLLGASAALGGVNDNNDDGGGGNRGILFQTAALVPLLYMSACVYGSLFKLSVFGPFCLRGHRQSLGVALIFNAQYLVRLQFPLAYNYLMM